MNMTDNDKELAMAIWNNGRPQGMTYSGMFHRYHTAKLEQAASGFEEWVKGHPFLWTSDSMKDIAREGYQAGAASQQPAIAALTEEVERLKVECDELRDSLNDAEHAPWPEWATQCLKIVRKHSGYDGFDDVNGIDLPEELEEALGEYGAQLDRTGEQLQSAQLDNKRLRELAQPILTQIMDIAVSNGADSRSMPEEYVALAHAICFPLDTSAADELLARVKELEEKLEMGTRMVQNSMARDQQRTQQLTTARSALVEAREALETCTDGDYSTGHVIDPSFDGDAVDSALATINAALGEEQKKEGGE